MKVKKKKEQWFAVKWEGGPQIPEELWNVFRHMEVHDWDNDTLEVSYYDPDKKGWKSVRVATGMWAVFSDRRKVKAMHDSDFRERWEEDV
jgi:hypothetical protein